MGLDSPAQQHLFRRTKNINSNGKEFARAWETDFGILDHMDEVLVNGVVFIDLKKSFNNIDHVIMLNKLKSIGIDSTSLAWFHSYLSSRSQKPVIGQVTSKSRKVTIGFPQGSILGHCLSSTSMTYQTASKIANVTLFLDNTLHCTLLFL